MFQSFTGLSKVFVTFEIFVWANKAKPTVLHETRFVLTARRSSVFAYAQLIWLLRVPLHEPV